MVQLAARAICAAIVCLAGLQSAESEDAAPAIVIPKPMRQELDKAKARCRSAAATAQKNMLKAFDREVKKAAGDRTLSAEQRVALSDKLAAEKTAFEKSAAEIPTSAPMQSAAKEYRNQCDVARKRCEEAYEKAGRGLLGSGNAAAVKLLGAEREELLAELGLAPMRCQWVGKSTENGVEYIKRLTSRGAGEWIETVNDLPGTNVFRETARTATCVELHDATRGISLRLYDSRAEAKAGTGPWHEFSKGGWEAIKSAGK
jgi:hypothetical protein